MAMAFRAGAALADLEFVQFHPTVLAANRLLLSEALRGAGAVLVDDEGRRFTDELAPRDVVARAVAEGDGASRPARDRPRALPGADGGARRRGLRSGP
jgi:aspartate oxidase